MLLPDPVGATKSTSAPDSAAATTSPWPGRNSASPKVCSRTVRAAAEGCSDMTGGDDKGTGPRYQVGGSGRSQESLAPSCRRLITPDPRLHRERPWHRAPQLRRADRSCCMHRTWNRPRYKPALRFFDTDYGSLLIPTGFRELRVWTGSGLATCGCWPWWRSRGRARAEIAPVVKCVWVHHTIPGHEGDLAVLERSDHAAG